MYYIYKECLKSSQRTTRYEFTEMGKEFLLENLLNDFEKKVFERKDIKDIIEHIENKET